MTYFQQGDVLFLSESIPSEAKKNDKFDGVVQYGESTGHAHRLSGEDFEEYHHENRRYLRLLKETPVRHEEHNPIHLPKGDYEIRIVREKDHFSDLVRPVVD